jgi:hypothetical protein
MLNDHVTLDDVVQNLLEFMKQNDDPETEEYANLVDQLAKLYKMKEIESNCQMKAREFDSRKFGMSPDVLATVAANIFGIVAIIAHERVNVITTKALGFVMRAAR